MTTQANAYFANKLKERELNEVLIPQVGLKSRELNEVSIPKVEISRFEAVEKQRSNIANEEQRKRELDETRRYNNLSSSVNMAKIAEDTRWHNLQDSINVQKLDLDTKTLNFKKDTTYTVDEAAFEKEKDRIAGLVSKPVALATYSSLSYMMGTGYAESNPILRDTDKSKASAKTKYFQGLPLITNRKNTPTQLVYDEESSTPTTAWYRVPSTK